MGKIVKHCAACDESFAEKFGYCPNCGASLQTFEMNPLTDASAVREAAPNTAKTADFGATASLPHQFEKSTKVDAAVVTGANGFSTNGKSALTEEVKVNDFEKVKSTTEKTDTFVAAPAVKTNGNGRQSQTANHNFQTTETVAPAKSDGEFNITVIEEKNVKQRNMLLLGSMTLMLVLVLGGTVYSLFNRDLMIGAIDEGNPLYVGVVDDEPMPVEEIKKPKNDKDAGGGGGGGSENPEKATQGRLPNQVERPSEPLMMVKKMTNPDIVIRNETQGTIKRPPTDEQVGVPNGLTSDRLSGGRGSGGGFGEGTGTGAGNGRGTGEGNGIGSGSGNGNGNGNGDGRGDGNQGRGAAPPPPPVKKPEPVGVTEGVKIVAKPRANYTDAARQNQVQGTVTLRVTFSASGAIGGISPVSGLPYGLTEQAIAAARGIRFEPAKKNGVPYTVTKQVQYSFTIY